MSKSKLPTPCGSMARRAAHLHYSQYGTSSQVMLYPMLPFMVRDFGVANSQIGLYVGILGTAYNLLQIPANIIWGKVSDVYGRRPVLIFGQLALAVTTVCLGLAPTLPTALLARSASGMLNGNVAVAAAAISDVTPVPDRPRAFSLLGFVFSLAFGLGPLVGSFLARPATWDTVLKGGPFDKYPYLLACSTASLIALLGAAAAAFVLKIPPPRPEVHFVADDATQTGEESHPQPPTRMAPEDGPPPPRSQALGAPLLSADAAEQGRASNNGAWSMFPRNTSNGDLSPHSAPIVYSGPPPSVITLDPAGTASLSASASLSLRAVQLEPPEPSGSFASLCCAHFGFGFLVAGGAELFPLFASAPDPDGLGWSTNQVSGMRPLTIGPLPCLWAQASAHH